MPPGQSIMATRRMFLSPAHFCLRLLLIMVGAVALTGCTWTEMLQGPELDPIETIEITDAPPQIVTPRPQTINASEDLTGEWVGEASLDDGSQIYYALVLTQDGTEITGIARASDEVGAASVDVRGTYEDGLLQLEEYGGETSGDWEGQELCYWRLELQSKGSSLRMRLEGPFAGIPNSEGTCTTTGEITLSR
jgi:hypothetical protein